MPTQPAKTRSAQARTGRRMMSPPFVRDLGELSIGSWTGALGRWHGLEEPAGQLVQCLWIVHVHLLAIHVNLSPAVAVAATVGSWLEAELLKEPFLGLPDGIGGGAVDSLATDLQ